MKTGKGFKLGLVVMLAVFISILAGCQKDVVNNAKSLVANAEKQGTALKKETNYDQRLKTYKEKAFSAPSKSLVQKTVLGFEKAQSALKDIKDEQVKKDLENRLGKVQLTINEAKLLEKAVDDSKKFEDSKTAFVKFVSENPLSADIDTKLADFQKQVDAMNQFKGTIKDKSLANELQVAVIGDSDQQIQTAKTVITARNDINDLTNLVANNGSSTDIDAKSKELAGLISGLSVQSLKDSLSAKQTEVLKPYNDKLLAEQQKAQQSSSVATVSAPSTSTKTSTSTTASKTTTSTATASKPSTSSTSTKTTTTSGSSTSSSSGSSSTPAPATTSGLNPLGQKIQPIYSRYGFVTKNGSPDPTAKICGIYKNGNYIASVMSDKLSLSDSSGVTASAEVAVFLGLPASASEVVNTLNQAFASKTLINKGSWSADGRYGFYVLNW